MWASGLFAAVLLHRVTETVGAQLGKNVTPFAESIFGVYELKPGVPTKAILGPIAYDFLAYGEGGLNAGFSALRDPDTDDVWFTLLDGQMWHVTGNETQYCFGSSAPPEMLSEQSPFSVDAVTETSVNICWRRGLYGMPTQAAGCSGCDCARILLNLTEPDTLHFQFWMSPPMLHADLTFVRTGLPPTFQQAIESTMTTPYQQCQIVDHYGPNVPGEPDLRTTTSPPALKLPGSGCTQSLAMRMMKMKNDDLLVLPAVKETDEGPEGQCYQLNGVNLQLDNQARQTRPQNVMNVSDVKVRFTTPAPPCDPCDVVYSVSAKIEDDEYIAVGFKGRSWERDFPYPPETPRPCYFGMCIDPSDNFSSDRIALGYTANGGCVREMVSKNLVGTPVDVDDKILKDILVERHGDRTILRFTISQHWQYPDANSTGSKDGPWRIMWAIGKVTGGNACAATFGFHFNHRGMAPLKWLTSGSTPCTWSDGVVDNALPTIV
jgi:hypothetical protein